MRICGIKDFMKKVLMFWVFGLLVGLAAGFGYGYVQGQHYVNKTALTAQKTTPEPTIAQLLALVNAERAKYGVAPLKEDPRLDASAQMKANDEVAYGYFGHESSKSPNDDGDSRQWLLASGIQCVDTSENLVDNVPSNPTASGAVDAWISSPPHHAAMIDAKYTLTGFGINGYEIVEHFCQTQ